MFIMALPLSLWHKKLNANKSTSYIFIFTFLLITVKKLLYFLTHESSESESNGKHALHLDS